MSSNRPRVSSLAVVNRPPKHQILSDNANISEMARPSTQDAPPKRRISNIYDAVAGRIISDRFLPANPVPSSNRDTLSTSRKPVPPEEVLFRRKNAPIRYEEDDVYFQKSAAVPEGQRLPDSELCKAVHCYASDFYTTVFGGKAKADWGALDETALLAMGILLEEAMGEILGREGDGVFVEGEDEEDLVVGLAGRERSAIADDDARIKSGKSRKKNQSRKRKKSGADEESEEPRKKKKKRKRKRKRKREGDGEVENDGEEGKKPRKKKRKKKHGSEHSNNGDEMEFGVH
ncbi:MAG: hypothetical protein M1819_003647 [Sarea resinae]|nr:MAG: hypothetical protein M1819_003647 [Sarea resinae]